MAGDGDRGALDPTRSIDDPKDPMWRATINKNLIVVIKHLNDPTGDITQEDYNGALSYLADQEAAHPDEYAAVAKDVTGFVQASGGTIPGMDKPDVNSLLQGILGGNSATTRNTKIATTSTSTQSTLTRQRQYVDVPTAAEFLDNFQNGYRGALQSLRDSGQLSSIGYDLALQQEGDILDLYLGELSKRAAAGENIFKVVGATGEPQKEGERVGQIASQGTIGSEQSTQQESSTQSTAYGGGGGMTPADLAAQQAAGTATGGGATQTQTEQGTTEKTAQSTDKSYQGTVEEIYSRPNLAVVHTLSPADFISQQFKPGQLETYLRSRKGTAVRERETAAGAPVVQARRV